MPKLSELSTESKPQPASSSSVKLSQLSSNASEQASPAQEKLNKDINKVRQFLGKATIAGQALPSVIGQELVTGRLMKDNPLEQSTGNIMDAAANSASFGIPKAIMKKVIESGGLKFPEIENKNEKMVGEIIGLIAPTKVAVAIANQIPGLAGRTVAKSIGRGIFEGSFVGGTHSPDEFFDLTQRVKQASVGGVVGGVAVPLSKGVQNLGRVAFKAKDFAGKVRSTLFESKASIGKQFESQLDDLMQKNPGKVIDLSEPFNKVKEVAKTNSRLISDLKLGAKKAGVDPKLIEEFIDKPSSASEMTLNQSRDIKRAVSNVPSISTNFKKGKFASFSDTDIDLIDFADEVKGKQLSVFPELEQVNKAYSDKITKYNLVKDKFRVGKLLDNIEKNFGDKEVQGVIGELLPKEVIREMGGFRMAAKFLKTMGWVAASGITGAALTTGGTAAYRAIQGQPTGNFRG